MKNGKPSVPSVSLRNAVSINLHFMIASCQNLLFCCLNQLRTTTN